MIVETWAGSFVEIDPDDGNRLLAWVEGWLRYMADPDQRAAAPRFNARPTLADLIDKIERLRVEIGDGDDGEPAIDRRGRA
jgi:hypothetical protein